MTMGMAETQLQLIRWGELRSDNGFAEAVGENLRTLLFADDETAQDAYEQLENPIVSQGHLFQCAPAVVSVIVAALAEAVIPAANLPAALDLLGRIVGGTPDGSEVALGSQDLRQLCHSEAAKGYWVLMKVARERDDWGAWRAAWHVLRVIDPDHAAAVLGEE